ncbi:MAG: patatin-like phospholipase family protein [Candidatus Omnitrophica bacterium]|nr:patatin-like phospholipase family protein [Candidatus Omnitrophota bacterium]
MAGPHEPAASSSSVHKQRTLKPLPLFAGLTDDELALVAQRARLVDVGKDELVYTEGDPPDALYVVVTGRARIFARGVTSQEETLQYVHRGDYFGVISLLTQQPHTVTVKAINDCLLVKIRQADFDALLKAIPSLAVHVSRTLSRRLSQKRRDRARQVFEATIVSVYSAVRGTGRTQYAINLADSLQRETAKRVILVDMSPSGTEIAALLGGATATPAIGLRGETFDPERVQRAIVAYPSGLATLNVAHDPRLASDETQIAPLLAFLAQEFHFVLVDLPREMDRTVFKALLQADLVHVVTDTAPENLTAARELLDECRRTLQLAVERVRLIVNGRAGSVSPPELEARLQHAVQAVLPAAARPLVEGGRPIVALDPGDPYAQAVRRLAREVGGVRVGLALGSGAALGLAHIGILRVLEREKIPIDVVAGSSIGALIGAFWASGMNAGQLEEVAMIFKGRWQTFNLFAPDIVIPLPTFGFITGRRIVRLLRHYLGDRTFQDLRVPLRIVTCDYAHRRLVVLGEGPVVDAVRASISIPAIFVPHPMNGRHMIDGGILDPVPVDVLLNMGVTKIIAVNTLPSPEDIHRRYEELAAEQAAREATMTGVWPKRWRWLKRRLIDLVEPKIADVIMHSMQAMEYILAEHGCQQADVSLHPTIPRINWYEFYSVETLVRRGEEEAERFLPQIKQLLAV